MKKLLVAFMLVIGVVGFAMTPACGNGETGEKNGEQVEPLNGEPKGEPVPDAGE